MEILLVWVVSFVISVLCLFVVVKVFGSSEADFKTVVVAAAIMTIVGHLLILIPAIGWIAVLIINVVIVKSVMECSTLMAILAVILWGGLQIMFVTGLGLSVGAL